MAHTLTGLSTNVVPARFWAGLPRPPQAAQIDAHHRINEQKSTLVTRAGRQRVCGIVTNERLNVARTEYDALKAILHNAALRGPGTQNRHSVPDFRAHLLGRIAWVAALNADRGERLRRQFDATAWDDKRRDTSCQ